LPLTSHKVLLNDSTKEPDISFYNLGFVESEGFADLQSVIIVEFKRPGHSSSRDPIDQIYDYIELIGSGKIRSEQGTQILIGNGCRYYGYIICDLYDKLIKESNRRDFKKTPDGMGFFRVVDNLNAYIEIIPFSKLLYDAKKRNMAFFNRLGLNL
jgi:hypothetical protein